MRRSKPGKHAAPMIRPQLLPGLLLASAGAAFSGLAALPTTGALSVITSNPGPEVLAVGGPETLADPVIDLQPALPKPIQATEVEDDGENTSSEPVGDSAPKAETPLANAQVRASRSTARVERTEFAPPTNGRLTSSYGPRWGRMHGGLDLGAPYGAPVRAVATGTVSQAGYGGGYGKLTIITHSDGTETFYAHQSKILVSPGDKVLAGETIGLIGSTGNSTGPHLHFEVHTSGGGRLNPRTWLGERGIDY